MEQSGRTEERTEESQMDFFGKDRMTLGEGYAALARLDLDKASAIFNALAMQNSDFGDAKEGFAMASAWSNILWDLETRKSRDAALFLWEKIRTFDFSQWGGVLRTALIRKAADLLGDDACFLAPPDFCLGLLFFELADYERAEDAYRRLLEEQPDDAKLICRLGDSIYLQKRSSEARHCYARALLTFPRDTDLGGLEDAELKGIIKECGTMMTPVYGWLRGVLPLLDSTGTQATDEEHARALMIYQAVFHAEAARLRRDHRKMVEKRRALKELAPGVFEEYLARVM